MLIGTDESLIRALKALLKQTATQPVELSVLLLAGAISGTLAGLFGIGGGAVIVPVLSLIWSAQGMDGDLLIKMAFGTSLATISLSSITSAWSHHRLNAVQWPVVYRMAPAIMVGALLGALLVDVLPGRFLITAFIVFICFVVLQMMWGDQLMTAHRPLPGELSLCLGSMMIGMISALMGIAGGSLSVPYLYWHGVALKEAIGSAAAIGFPIALTATIGLMMLGLDEPNRPAYSVGYINLPAFAGVAAASISFAPLGAKIAHSVDQLILKYGYVMFLLVLAAAMSYGMR